jgi:hypothetical protein
MAEFFSLFVAQLGEASTTKQAVRHIPFAADYRSNLVSASGRRYNVDDVKNDYEEVKWTIKPPTK